MLGLITLVILLAVLNGFFAFSEMALMTSRKSRLRHRARTSRRAKIALALSEQPEQFLSTVQVFITLIGIGTGTALGVKLGDKIALLIDLLGISILFPYRETLGIIISVSVITFFSMLLGELLPKRLALVDPERLAIATAVPMRALTWLATPFAFVLIWLTRRLLWLTGLDRVSREQVSEEEIRLLVAEGAEQGIIDSDEHNMVNRVLRLGDRSVDSLMTPRNRIAWLDTAAPTEENLSTMRETPYSRYPVYRRGEHDVVGVLEVKRLIGRLSRSSKPDLFQTIAKPLYVPATARALDLLEEFRDAETPLALVVDEYGDIEGLVTLNDLLAAVVGKSATPSIETRDQSIIQRSDGSWLVDGSVSSDDLRELLGLTQLPNEEDHDFRTAAGMFMAQFGRIPHAGEAFDWNGFRFEVVDLDGPRIDKLLIVKHSLLMNAP